MFFGNCVTHIAINAIITVVFWWFRAYRNKPYNSLCFLMISSRKGVNGEAIGRQKWDPGEKHVKIHIVLEVKSKMYENIQKYLKMCKIENHINYCVFLMILNFWEPAFRPKIAQTIISIDSIEPPGTFPRIPSDPVWIPGSGVRKCCSDPTSTRAGGQDDVS